MTEKELKYFTIKCIENKLEENEGFVRYTFFELRVKYNLSEKETEEFLQINKNYFNNKNYKIYLTGENFEYQNMMRKVQDNELLIAIKQ